MTLVISKGITLRKGWQPMDPDAAAYITAVETADTEPLEEKTKIAIDNFVLGCKADGIWSAIKASCILAGARTLAGALVPLVGTAPTNFNFVSADYNRKTGLKGNASTKYLDANRSATEDPISNRHHSVYVSQRFGAGYIGFIDFGPPIIYNYLFDTNSTMNYSLAGGTQHAPSPGGGTGFVGASRNNSSQISFRCISVNHAGVINQTAVSSLLSYQNFVFARATETNAVNSPTASRFAFYSIGESLDLALLDARVTDLINAFAAAIP